MSKESNKSMCLKNIYENMYKASPNLEISGRYIKALHHVYSQIKDENERLECQYLINKCLSYHIIYLQEAIINGFDTAKKEPIISSQQGEYLKMLASSDYAVQEGKYSLMDIDDFKNMKMLDKSVILKKNLVLPCKIKSPSGKYHFNTQVVVTQSNVLAYASCNFDKNESQKNVNHNTLITKMGKGFKQALQQKKEQTVAR